MIRRCVIVLLLCLWQPLLFIDGAFAEDALAESAIADNTGAPASDPLAFDPFASSIAVQQQAFNQSGGLPIPSPPGLAAKSYLVIDFHTGAVIAESNANDRLEPASLTKMMTAYLVSWELKTGNISTETMVPVSHNAHGVIGSRTFLERGSTVSVRDLMYGLVVQSGNDAAVALAEYVGASEEGFASMMNHMAKRLGMNDTNFTNATGLPSKDHYTTARDMAKLARAVIRDHPEHYKLYSVGEFEYNGIKQRNRNTLLLRDKTVDGIKTGHTKSAGYCLVASAVRGNMRLISVLLGARNEELRSTESMRALNYGFRFYETVKIASADQTLGEVKVWGGTQDNLTVGVAEDKYATLPNGRGAGITREMHLHKDIVAPIGAGQPLGTLKIKLQDSVLLEQPIVAKQDIQRGGFFTRTGDTFKRLFR